MISLRMNVEDIVIPSEEEHVEMFPMDFEEFLWAMGDVTTVPYLRKCFEVLRPLGQAYILYTNDILIKENVIHLPIYMAMFL